MMIEYMGNMALLEQEMVAFLAPTKIAPESVLPTLDWASKIAKQGTVVVSGFSSRLESEVWEVLVRGTSPIVVVKVCNKYKVIPTKYRPLLESGRLLIVFLGLGTRLSRQTAPHRNANVALLTKTVVFPSMNKGSSLYPLFLQLKNEKKAIVLST